LQEDTDYASQSSLLISNESCPDKKEVIRNLYLSGIGEEFIAMQLDWEIPPPRTLIDERRGSDCNLF